MGYTEEELQRMDELEVAIEQARASIIENIPGAVVEMNAALRNLNARWDALYAIRVRSRAYKVSQARLVEGTLESNKGTKIDETNVIFHQMINGGDLTKGMRKWQTWINNYLGDGRQQGGFPTDDQFRERFDSQDLNHRQTIIADIFTKNHGLNFSSFNEADAHQEAFMVPHSTNCLQTFAMGKYSYNARKERHDSPAFPSNYQTLSDGWKTVLKRYTLNFLEGEGKPFFGGSAWEPFFLGRTPATYTKGDTGMAGHAYAEIHFDFEGAENRQRRGDYGYRWGAFCADTAQAVLFAGAARKPGGQDGRSNCEGRNPFNGYNSTQAPSIRALGARICRVISAAGRGNFSTGNPRVFHNVPGERQARWAGYMFWSGDHNGTTTFGFTDSERFYDAFNAAWHALDRVSAASNTIAALEESWVRQIDSLQRAIERDMPDWNTPAGIWALYTTDYGFDSDVAEESIQEYKDRIAPTGNVVGGAWQRQMLFKEQCFMLTYIQQIASRAADLKGIKRLAYLPGVRPPGYGISTNTAQGPGALIIGAIQSRMDALGIERTDTAAAANTGAGTSTAGSSFAYAQDNITWDGQACIMADGRPYAFVNQLTQDPDENAFFKMKTQEISSLQPMVRLYRVPIKQQDALAKSDTSVGETEIEYEFDDVTSEVNRLMRTHGQRGVGVGVKKFSFTYDGSNPFAAKKSIKATLEIFANSFGDLLKPRQNSAGQYYRYAELAMKTATNGPRMASADGSDADSSMDPADHPEWLTNKFGRVCKDDTGRSAEGKGPAQGSPDEVIAPTGKAEQNEWESKFNFVLKAVVGWAMPTGNNTLLSSAVRRGIYNSFVTLQLTPTVHEFDIDDQGRVIFRINYLAFTEDFYAQPLYSIFADKTIVARQTLRRLFYKYHAKLCDSEEMRNIKENDAEVIMEEKRRSVQSFIQALFDNDKIFYIDKPYPDLRAWISEGPFAENMEEVTILDSDSLDATLGAHVHEAIAAYDGENAEEVATALGSSVNAGVDPNAVQVGFFFISDMIDIALQNIEYSLSNQRGGTKELNSVVEKYPFHTGIPGESGVFQVDPCDFSAALDKASDSARELKNLRIVLGPLEIVDQGGNTSPIVVNIGDIPVSVKYFAEFLTKKLGSQNEVVYPLTTFLNDLVNDLIRNFLNNDTCFNTEIKQKIRVNSAAITSYKNKGTEGAFAEVDTLTEKIVGSEAGRRHRRLDLRNVPVSDRPLLNISGLRDMPDGGNPGRAGQINYMVYFAGRTSPREEMNANAAEDAQKGIQHYILGEDRGIVKKIKLSKTNSTGLQEVRYESAGYDAFKQLHIVYDVDIESYANVKTFPGSYVFVDPRGFAPQTNLKQGDQYNLTEYGIGGYCMIIRSTTVIEAGSATTKLHTKWVHSAENVLDAEQEEADTEANRGDNEDFTECRSLARSAPAAPSMEAPVSEMGWGDAASTVLTHATDTVGITDPATPSEEAE